MIHEGKHISIYQKITMTNEDWQYHNSIQIEYKEIPGIEGPPRPIAPPETAGWAIVGGLDIQPARGVGTGAAVA